MKMPQLKTTHKWKALRSEIGHWEVDTVIGKSHKTQILTLTERLSWFMFIQKLKSKSIDVTAKVIVMPLKKSP